MTRDPEVIAALNLLPGAAGGYLRLGQKKKALAALVGWLVLLLPPSCGVLSGLLSIAAAIDGYLQARQLQNGHSIGHWTLFGKHL